MQATLIEEETSSKVSYLISNIPHFKCWVRREFTHNHEDYQGDYLHALAIAVNTIPDRSLSFQVVFTGEETNCEDWDEVEKETNQQMVREKISKKERSKKEDEKSIKDRNKIKRNI